MIDISSYFLTLAGAAAAVTLISGWVNTHLLPKANSTWKQVVSWVISIAFAFLGQIKAIGMFADTNLLFTLLNGFAVGLVANGIYDIKFVQALLEFFKAKPKTV